MFNLFKLLSRRRRNKQPTTIKELLDKPSRWTQGCNAKDEFGLSVASTDSMAKSWCLLGAAYAVYGFNATERSIWPRIKSALYATFDTAEPISWQDDPHRTYEEVMQVVELAGV